MNAGQLNQRITIERRSAPANSETGSVTETWTPVSSCWADVVPQTALELQTGQNQAQVQAPFKVTLRMPRDVTERDRINWKGRILNIQQVLESVPNVRLDLVCVETR